jgi:hypothetical protein
MELKRKIGRPGQKLEKNIQMNLKDIECRVCIYLAQGRS